MKKLFLWTFTLMMLCAWSVALVPRHVRADTTSVLLIPETTNDRICMFDPVDGTYLGDFITGFGSFVNPRNAITGPDGNIYVTDYGVDTVFVFDINGNFLHIYADPSDGLSTIGGMEFRGGHLFLCDAGGTAGRVMEFDGPHNYIGDFIVSDLSAPIDILFLEDGRSLVSIAGGSVRLYNADGTFAAELFQIAIPSQIQADPQLPGAYLNMAYSGDQITDFDIDGTIHQTMVVDRGRGIYRLGNGNLLASGRYGVFEINSATGDTVDIELPGVYARFIELCVVDLPSGYPYLPGDVNMALGIWPPSVIGGDVTYLVGYFIGGGQAACMLDGFWASADINGDCQIIGGDVTALVGYFIAGGALEPCPDYESAWLEGIPDEQPSGWPNCDVPVINSKVIPTSLIE